MIIILILTVLAIVIYQGGFSSDLMAFFMQDCLGDNLEVTIICIIFLSYYFVKVVSSPNN